MSLLMGVTSLCNIRLHAVLGRAGLCPVLDVWMPPESWEAEAASRHVVHRQCFVKVHWGTVACPVGLGLLPEVPVESLVNTSVSSLCDYSNRRIWGSFLPQAGTLSISTLSISLYLGGKEKPCWFSLALNQTLTWAWKVWLFDGNPLYVPLLKGGDVFWCVEWDCKY